jgi:hypothetical protein
MTDDAFRTALHAFALRRPFRPFWIEFSSGDRVLVKHPEAAHIRKSVVLHKSPDRQNRVFDSSSVSQLLDVESAPSVK